MELFIYLLKTAFVLILFYSVYFIVLKKDTFFSANRYYLISGIIASFLLPLLIFSKIIYIDTPDVNLLIPINNTNIVLTNTTTNNIPFLIDWQTIFIIIYLTGVVFMSIRFIKQLRSLYKIIKRHSSTKINGCYHVKVTEDINPFSFFKYIIYNPKKHSENDLKIILKHEQAHAAQLHSVDIILSNLLLIIQWANPLAWLYKKSIEENLEFIADNETIQQIPSKTDYQLILLKVVSPAMPQPVLANNFYQSLIKKRIIMLQKNESPRKKQWKLLIILPLLGIFVWGFNVKEVVKYNNNPVISSAEILPKTFLIKKETIAPVVSKKQKKVTVKKPQTALLKIKKYINDKITVTITKATSNLELEKLKKIFKNNYQIVLSFNKVKRNKKGEIIAIKVKMKSENSNASFNQNSDNGIDEFSISYDKDNNVINIRNKKARTSHYSAKGTNGNFSKINEYKNGHRIKKQRHNSHTIHDHNHTIHDIDSDSHNKTHIIYNSNKDSLNYSITKRHSNSHTTIIRNGDDINKEILFIDSNDNNFFAHNKLGNDIFIFDNDNKNTLVYIDGKKSTKDALKKLKYGAIKKIKMISGEEAIKKYGEEASDGVILLTTKKRRIKKTL